MSVCPLIYKMLTFHNPEILQHKSIFGVEEFFTLQSWNTQNKVK